MAHPAADPISTFILQHNLIPWLLSYTGLTTYTALRKHGSAAKQLVIDALSGLTEVHAAICKFWFDCKENRRRYARPPEDKRPNSPALKLKAKA